MSLPGLPRELRDEIYGYLLNSAPIAVRDRLPLEALPSGTREYAQDMHSLLRVNQLLRGDALEHIKKKRCHTYLVSQRYRAFTGLQSMAAWKPAPIPAHARRIYLRIYVTVPRHVARPIAQAAQSAMMRARALRRRDTWLDEFPKVFTVLTTMMRNCLELEDLVLEVVIKRQETHFGEGCESTEENDLMSTELEDICRAEMEQVVRELPSMRRYAILGSDGRKFVRRNTELQWTRQCLIPECVAVCHCYGDFSNTCVEDKADLLRNLTPSAREEWLNVSRLSRMDHETTNKGKAACKPDGLA